MDIENYTLDAKNERLIFQYRHAGSFMTAAIIDEEFHIFMERVCELYLKPKTAEDTITFSSAIRLAFHLHYPYAEPTHPIQ